MASQPLGVDLDLNKNAILNVALQTLSSAPSSPATAQIYYNSGSGLIEYYNGSAWVPVGSGSGTVSTVSVASANGFAGSVANSSTTPAITISTSVTGILKGNGTAVSAAAAGTDYLAPDGDGSALTGITVSQVDGAAPSVSPTFTGVPTAPTASSGTNTNQIATTAFVEQSISVVAQGLDPKPTATVATTAALPACTYSNGTSGVEATLTGNSDGALTVDSYAVQAGDRVLVKNQASGLQNGLYSVTQAGSGGSPFVLMRVAEMDTTAEFAGAYIVVEDAGSANANSFWVCTNSANPTVGTTAITFAQLNGATQLTAGTGITISGNTVSITSAYRGNGIGTVNGFAYGDGAGNVSAASVANLRTLGGLTKYSALIGNGSATQFTISQGTHGLSADQQLDVTVVEVATETVWLVSTKISTGGTVTLDFNVAPTTNQFRVTIRG